MFTYLLTLCSYSYGLLGPSGCGKTTLLRCIVGLLKVDSGSLLAMGDIPASRNHSVPGPMVGYMPQVFAVTPGTMVGYMPQVFAVTPDPMMGYMPQVYPVTPDPMMDYMPHVFTVTPGPMMGYMPEVFTSHLAL